MKKDQQPPPLPHYQVTAGVVWNGAGQFLIAQRNLESTLGGLWEFPGGKQEPGESLKSCLRRELLEELGIEVSVGALLTVVEHTYAHLRITLHVFHCQLVGGRPQARATTGRRRRSLPPRTLAGTATSRTCRRTTTAMR